MYDYLHLDEVEVKNISTNTWERAIVDNASNPDAILLIRISDNRYFHAPHYLLRPYDEFSHVAPKPVRGIKDGLVMLRFPSMKAASRTLANRDSNQARSRVHKKLTECCTGKRELYWGMRWEYGI